MDGVRLGTGGQRYQVGLNSIVVWNIGTLCLIGLGDVMICNDQNDRCHFLNVYY